MEEGAVSSVRSRPSYPMVRLLLLASLCGSAASPVAAQFVPLADSAAYLRLDEAALDAYAEQRLGLQLRDRTVFPWTGASERTLAAHWWIAQRGEERLGEAEAYLLAGLPDAAEAARRKLRAARLKQWAGLGVGMAGAVLLGLGAEPIFVGEQLIEGTGTTGPDGEFVPPQYEDPEPRPVLLGAGTGLLIAGGVTFTLGMRQRRRTVRPLRDLVPGFGARNAALTDALVDPAAD